MNGIHLDPFGTNDSTQEPPMNGTLAVYVLQPDLPINGTNITAFGMDDLLQDPPMNGTPVTNFGGNSSYPFSAINGTLSPSFDVNGSHTVSAINGTFIIPFEWNDFFQDSATNGSSLGSTNESLASQGIPETCLTNECLFWQDVLGIPLTLLTASLGGLLNGFLLWVLHHAPGKTPFDTIQINQAVCYLIDAMASPIVYVLCRCLVLLGNVSQGLYFYLLDLVMLLANVTLDNIVTIFLTTLRSVQVTCF